MAVANRLRLFTEVLTVRLPMSPEAANEKLVEAALAVGIIPFKKVEKESTDRISSSTAKGGTRFIRFAEEHPSSYY